MQLDFHYYATYCAACIAGCSHEEAIKIAYSAQFTDCCSRTLLQKIGGPLSAATTQLQLEMMEARSDAASLRDITRIWSSFHFLPGDLYAEKKCSKRFLHKYRMICNTDSALLVDTVELARGKGPEAAGIAMHILADTWAHRYFAGTPSLVINNTNYDFYEIVGEGEEQFERKVRFSHNPSSADNLEKSIYVNTLFQGNESSVMNLGHGRAGHLPDYGFARYRYMPAWGDYMEILKDNPSDYMCAFGQMVYALKCLLADGGRFETGRHGEEDIAPWRDRIRDLLIIRRYDAGQDWKALGEELSGCQIEDFDEEKYQKEYMDADPEGKDDTFLGRYILAALAQKSMVTNRIFQSGNRLAGFSIDFEKSGLRGNRDFYRLAKKRDRSKKDDQN
ncbi:MAG: hypothetical protein IJH71_08780 [Eubacterium sp.]|nr:hypothetical protein [Eubacterium sp.]